MLDSKRLRLVALVVSAAGLVVAGASAQDRPTAEGQVPPEINKVFQDPDLDAQEYVERFESESREVYAKRDAIVEAVGLEPGMEVADLGAGTGLFTLLFAERVKPEGTVYAVDIAPAFLELIAERAAEQDLGEVVKTVRGARDATNLEPRSVDVVFISDTYHHFEDPGAMLASIRRALRPGGRLVIVEFDKEKAKSDFVAKHVRAPREVFLREIEEAGFEPLELASAPELSENFMAAFRKAPADRGQAAKRARAKAAPQPAEARP